MGSGRWWWLGLAVVEPVVLYAWHQWLVLGHGAAPAEAQLSYGIGFALFGALMLGALARLRVTAYPPVWRMLTLMAGAAAALVEIKLHGYPKAYFFPLWAAALIGLSVVSIGARMLPKGLRKIWLAGETD